MGSCAREGRISLDCREEFWESVGSSYKSLLTKFLCTVVPSTFTLLNFTLTLCVIFLFVIYNIIVTSTWVR